LAVGIIKKGLRQAQAKFPVEQGFLGGGVEITE